MSLATSVHDIKTFILSFHPLVVIETSEEERVANLLQRAIQDLTMPFFNWSITQGLRRSTQAYAVVKTKDPLALHNFKQSPRDSSVGCSVGGVLVSVPSLGARSLGEETSRLVAPLAPQVGAGSDRFIRRDRIFIIPAT